MWTDHVLNIMKELYIKKLNKTCFAHDSAYSDSKDLAKRTVSDKILKHRDYKIAINPKYDRYHRGLASIVYKFFDKKTGSGAKASVNEGLAQELHKPVIKKNQNKEIICQV